MSRIIFFVLIIAVIYFAWRSMRLKQIQLEKRLDKQEKANLAEHKNDMPGEKDGFVRQLRFVCSDQ